MSTKSMIVEEACAVHVCLFGRVQGLGVRPAIARLAAQLLLGGTAVNTSEGVTLELEGAADAIRQFLAQLTDFLPAGAAIDRMDVAPGAIRQQKAFHILEQTDAGAKSATIPLDRVVCSQCLAEMDDPFDPRHAYPLTSCTACGPRYSIIESMPYDRAATTMVQFSLCPRCDVEYRKLDDRRFHSQTNCCSQCGPRIHLTDHAGPAREGQDAIQTAALALRAGRILALKGLGGYQLLADATSTEAVSLLRERKQRQTKPLAVLVGSVDDAEQLAILNVAERELLADPAGPIVVVRCRAGTPLADDIAPGFHSVGIMMPTTPLHAMLLRHVALPLVCTSGNREGEPLVFERAEAERELKGIADLWLHHDRPIARPIDDSVVRVMGGKTCFLRMARGYAPHVLTLPLNARGRQIVACGGEQKSAFALWNGFQAVLGPHIGDLTSAAACERWAEQLKASCSLYDIRLASAEIVHDRHPDYFTTRWSQPFRARSAVQHHHAHLAAVMLEHALTDREVIGLAWDGTGYGEDRTVWGGECLRSTCSNFQRVAWLRPFPLLGGELAVREPWRIAVALVSEALGPDSAISLTWPEISSAQIQALLNLAARPRLSPRASSMGRLFDAVAALVLGIRMAGDEGRPAMLLEEACYRHATGTYSLPWNRQTGHIDWRPLMVAILTDLQLGETPGAIAMRFHRAVAHLAVVLASTYENLPLVTAGGVFQNAILVELLAEQLAMRRAGWFRSLVIPPGDGGLAAGQLAVAAARIHCTRKE